MKKQENNYAFIDGNNLNLGIKSMGWKLDFCKFRRYLKEKYKIKIAYIFLGFVAGNQSLYSSLQGAGFILSFKPTVPDKDGNVKGNIDANLVLQAMIDYKKYDKAIIITSDGDFYCLAQYLYEKDKLLKVMSPYVKTCSSLLRRAAKEKIVFMDNLRKKLEYDPKMKKHR